MIRIPSIPPPEELARRRAARAFALAALDGAWQAAVNGAVLIVGCALVAAAIAVILGLGWTSLRFGEWVYSAFATPESHAPGANFHAFMSGGLAALGMFFTLTAVVSIPNWIEARAGHAMPSGAKFAVCAAWWAVVCGAVWTLT